MSAPEIAGRSVPDSPHPSRNFGLDLPILLGDIVHGMAGLVNENLKHTGDGIPEMSPKDAEKLRQLQEIMARRQAEEANERIHARSVFQPIYDIPGAGGATEAVIQTDTARYHVYDIGYWTWATDVYVENVSVFPGRVWNDLLSVGYDMKLYVGENHIHVGGESVEVDPNLESDEFYITFKLNVLAAQPYAREYADPQEQYATQEKYAIFKPWIMGSLRDGVKITNIAPPDPSLYPPLKYPTDNIFRSKK